MKKEIIAAMGLIIGAVLGIAGSFAPSANLRGIAWGIDGTTIIVGCAIMTVRFLRSGDDMLAAGFIVYAIGEGLVQLVCAMAPDSSSPFFCRGYRPLGRWNGDGEFSTRIPRLCALDRHHCWNLVCSDST